jgi:hypothetical protein
MAALRLRSPGWVVVAAALLLVGCSAGGNAVNEAADPAPVAIDVTALPAPPAAVRLQQTYDGPLRASLAADGSVAAVLGPDGLFVWTNAGTLAWQGAAGGTAVALPGGLVVRGPAAGDAAGAARLFDPNGNAVWQQAATGPVEAQGAPDASRVAVADQGGDNVWLVSADGQRTLHLAASGPAHLRFTANDALVVDDGSQVTLIDADWRQHALCPGGCSGPSRVVAPARDAAWLAVATGDGDDTLYLFRRDGSALWRRALPGGGDDGLVVAPSGGVLLAFGLGPAGGLAAVSPADGALRWAATFGAAGTALPVRAAAYTAQGNLLVLAAGRTATYVVALRGDGTPLAALPLPAGSAVALGGPRGDALVTVDNGDGTSTVTWYDLSGAFGGS